MKLVDRLFRRKPESVTKPIVDEHTFYFGAPAPVEPQSEISGLRPREADEFIVRHRFAPSLYEKQMGLTVGTFVNSKYDTLEEAHEAVLKGLRAYAVGNRQYCPVALIRVHWRGALRRRIDEVQEKAE